MEGTTPLLREELLLSGPLLYAHFSARLELGLDSASSVLSQAQGRWPQTEDYLTRKLTRLTLKLYKRDMSAHKRARFNQTIETQKSNEKTLFVQCLITQPIHTSILPINPSVVLDKCLLCIRNRWRSIN